MSTPGETFQKYERLCSRKIITYLFDEGNIFYAPLLKVVWQISPALLPSPAQAAFSVSKKGFRHAVSRNLLKRRMREAYRKNKHILYNHLDLVNLQIVFIVIYRENIVSDYIPIEKSMKEVLEKLIVMTREAYKNC
jgi:ribonuclease P protein component